VYIDAGCCGQYTVSIAVPGSILDNAQSAELRTYLVGQVCCTLLVCKLVDTCYYHVAVSSLMMIMCCPINFCRLELQFFALLEIGWPYIIYDNFHSIVAVCIYYEKI